MSDSLVVLVKNQRGRLLASQLDTGDYVLGLYSDLTEDDFDISALAEELVRSACVVPDTFGVRPLHYHGLQRLHLYIAVPVFDFHELGPYQWRGWVDFFNLKGLGLSSESEHIYSVFRERRSL